MFRLLVCAIVSLVLCGCASWLGAPSQYRHAGSAVDYLYPDAKEAPNLAPDVTHLRPPVRVGIAFAPGSFGPGPGGEISESMKLALLERVKASFAPLPYIGAIEIIPSNYLRARGGFDNLDQVSRLFNVEVVALVSYDQVQFNDTNGFALLYWTIVGAYVIHGDKYDVQTLLDTVVVDVASRKLLFRAPGTSVIKGTSSMAEFSERTRGAQTQGFVEATDRMIPELKTQLEQFRERIKTDSGFRIENKPGYHGAGDIGLFGVLGALMLLGVLNAARRSR